MRFSQFAIVAIVVLCAVCAGSLAVWRPPVNGLAATHAATDGHSRCSPRTGTHCGAEISGVRLGSTADEIRLTLGSSCVDNLCHIFDDTVHVLSDSSTVVVVRNGRATCIRGGCVHVDGVSFIASGNPMTSVLKKLGEPIHLTSGGELTVWSTGRKEMPLLAATLTCQYVDDGAVRDIILACRGPHSNDDISFLAFEYPRAGYSPSPSGRL